MSRRIKRPMPGQQPTLQPSWAKDFVTASDPKASGDTLKDLVTQYTNASANHHKRQAPAILGKVAQNPNAPRELLAYLSKEFYTDIVQNAILPLLVLDPVWCSNNLDWRLLELALPEIDALRRERREAALNGYARGEEVVGEEVDAWAPPSDEDDEEGGGHGLPF